jgi:hypothetical protein
VVTFIGFLKLANRRKDGKILLSDWLDFGKTCLFVSIQKSANQKAVFFQLFSDWLIFKTQKNVTTNRCKTVQFYSNNGFILNQSLRR